MTSSIDLDRLEALAKAATPGPYRVSDFEVLNGSTDRMVMADDNYALGYILGRGVSENEANAAFIAALNPQTVLALISASRGSGVPEGWGPIRESYKQGWNDRESDFIERLERIAPEPDGAWALVPANATEAMYVAFTEAEDASLMIDPLGAFEDAYRAMIAAAGKPK